MPPPKSTSLKPAPKHSKNSRFDEQRPVFIAKKFGCKPIDLIPHGYRPEVISKDLLKWLVKLVKCCDKMEVVQDLIRTVMRPRVTKYQDRKGRWDNFKLPTVTSQDIVYIIQAFSQYKQVNANVSSIGTDFALQVEEIYDTAANNSDTTSGRVTRMKIPRECRRTLKRIQPASKPSHVANKTARRRKPQMDTDTEIGAIDWFLAGTY